MLLRRNFDDNRRLTLPTEMTLDVRSRRLGFAEDDGDVTLPPYLPPLATLSSNPVIFKLVSSLLFSKSDESINMFDNISPPSCKNKLTIAAKSATIAVTSNVLDTMIDNTPNLKVESADASPKPPLVPTALIYIFL